MYFLKAKFESFSFENMKFKNKFPLMAYINHTLVNYIGFYMCQMLTIDMGSFEEGCDEYSNFEFSPFNFWISIQ